MAAGAIFAPEPNAAAVPLSYTVREGLAGFRRARFAAFTATSALTVALILVAVFGLAAWQGSQVTDWLRQRVGEVQLFVAEQADARATEAIRLKLEATPGVEEVEYVSREDAVEEFRRVFGEEADVLPVDDVFLPASFRVRLASRYANADSLGAIASEFETWNRVDEVFYNQPLLAKVQENLRVLTPVALGLGLVVVLAALVLVGNTIRLTIYARRMLIRTMKLVGATDGFIRRPFLVEGLAQGFVAGALASLLVFPLYELVLGFVPQLQGWPGGTPVFTVLGVLVLGLLLGWLGAWVATRRFIKSVRLS
ncbi:MAG: permease-like cell division protein FtsX [Rhodothermales bacterium]|nr:permease-like cell division protein FtsX [Rhodothermales bacterium]